MRVVLVVMRINLETARALIDGVANYYGTMTSLGVVGISRDIYVLCWCYVVCWCAYFWYLAILLLSTR